MKKFIKALLLFSLFATLFYVGSLLIISKNVPRPLKGNVLTENRISASDLSNIRYKVAEKTKPLDLIIIGSSHAYRGYDVRIFRESGLKAYNLGSSAQPLNVTQFIYNRYIDQLKPKKIIIDIYPVLLSNTGGESEINLVPLFYNDIRFIKNALITFDVRVLNSLLYFQVYGDINTVKSKMNKGETYIDGGYISSFKVAKKIKEYESTTLKIEEKNIVALKNIVNDAKNRGVKVYLFQSPLPEARYKSYENNKEIDSLMRSIGTYYNYNEVGFLPNEYFFDDSHINQKGVDVYNKWVIEKIMKK